MNIYGDHDDRTKAQLARCVAAEDGAVGVLCADGHLGYSMPIGGVVGHLAYVSPSGVGFDIACGNLAVKTNLNAADLTEHDFKRIADTIQKRVSFGVGRSNDEPVDDHPVLETISHSPVRGQHLLFQTARNQLGTVGSGNHYVDVLQEQDGTLWVGVHFGSRGFGFKTAAGFLNIAAGRAFDDRPGRDDMDAPPALLSVNDPSGQDYLTAMEIAGQYAYAGREVVVATVLQILGAQAVDTIHNHHNFTWKETHHGQVYYVVRKGATPAFPGQRGFVGGSMGDISVILHGVDSPESAALLYSTVHGAGRVMSRRAAAGRSKFIEKWCCRNYRACDFKGARGGFRKEPGGPTPTCPNCGHKLDLRRLSESLSPGLVDFAAVQTSMASKGIVLRGAGADEAPQVYRSLADVLHQHAGTVVVDTVLHPRIVVMAGDDIVDPYKD